MKAPTIIALLHGPDQPGLVSRVSSWIFLRGSNIHHADQHKDLEANIFFQRVEWTPSGQIDEEAAAFEKFAHEDLGMTVKVAKSTDRPKVALFVSKIDHCFHDTICASALVKWPASWHVLSPTMTHSKRDAETYGIPFYHVPVLKETKAKPRPSNSRSCTRTMPTSW